MTETQLSICTWADATFGPASDVSIAARALEEMAELVTACANGEPAERIGEEIADVVIALARLGRSLGLDVVTTVRVSSALVSDSERSPVGLAGFATSRLGEALLRIDAHEPMIAKMLIRRAVEFLTEIALDINVDLHAAIDRKMAINRTRRWVTDGKGHGRHVKEGS